MMPKVKCEILSRDVYYLDWTFFALLLFQRVNLANNQMMQDDKSFYSTRLHSSRMRTARLITVSQHALRGVCARGVCLGGVCLPGGYLPSGCLPGGSPTQEVAVNDKDFW